MLLHMLAIRGPLAGRGFPLTAAPLSFGRTPENVVVIASALASRRHAEVRFEDGAFVLYDLGSSNGTRVNGQPIQVHRLNPGDVVEIGDEAFRCQTAATDAPTLMAAPPPASLPPPPTPRGPAASSPQQPLPPMASNLPPPPHATAPRSKRTPIIIAVALLLSCTLLAAVVGGIALARSLDWSAPPTAGGGGTTTGGGSTTTGGGSTTTG
ncbi:MAG: FHA domain-containing protein, partial [Candidatus Viridilinea halotolerans]